MRAARSLIIASSEKSINKTNICKNKSNICINIIIICTNKTFIYTFQRSELIYPPKWCALSNEVVSINYLTDRELAVRCYLQMRSRSMNEYSCECFSSHSWSSLKVSFHSSLLKSGKNVSACSGVSCMYVRHRRSAIFKPSA